MQEHVSSRDHFVISSSNALILISASEIRSRDVFVERCKEGQSRPFRNFSLGNDGTTTRRPISDLAMP